MSDVFSREEDVCQDAQQVSHQSNIKKQMSTKVYATFFHDIYDRQGIEAINAEMTWGAFGGMLEMAAREPLVSKIDAKLFSPIAYNGTRCRQNAAQCGMLVLDSDDGLLISQVVELLQGDGIESIAYTSASNRAGERFRVITPLREPVDADTQIGAVKAFKDYIAVSLNVETGEREGQWKVDKGKLNPYSLFYLPARYESAGENEFHHISGDILSADGWLEAYPQEERSNAERSNAEPLAYERDERQDREDRDLTWQRAEAALEVIDPAISYNGWLDIGMALKSEFEEDGFYLWDNWSHGGGAKYKAAEMQPKWRSFHSGGIGIGTLFKIADEADRDWRQRHRDRKRPHLIGENMSVKEMLEELRNNPPTQEEMAKAYAEQTDDSYDDPRREEKKPEKPRRRFRSRREQKDEPAPTWLIEGLIPEDADVAIYANWGSLKTFLATDLAFAIATGGKALGVFPVSTPGPVFFFVGEGYKSMGHKRATAWEIEHGYEPYSVENIFFSDGVPITTDDRMVDEDIEDIEDILAGQKAKLFVIDTMNRALNGQDEDKAHVASKYLNTVKKIRDRIGGSSLTIAHLGKDPDRGGRGSSGFEAGFDTILTIDQCEKNENGEHVISFYVRKQKDADDGQRFYCKARVVATPQGDSLILESISEDEGLKALMDKRATKSDTNPDAVVAAIKELVPNGGLVGQNELAKKIAEMTDQKVETVKKQLSRQREGIFRKYIFDGKWCMPGCHLIGSTESLEDQLASLVSEPVVAKPNAIFV